MTIRRATLEDSAKLSFLHAASFDGGWSRDDFTTWLSRAESFAVLACRNDEPAAFGLALAAGDDAELLTIATIPALRRTGLGRQVFDALDAQASQRGLKRWVLEVAWNNPAAVSLYKSRGFVEIGVRKAYYDQGRERIDALVLARPAGLISGQGTP